MPTNMPGGKLISGMGGYINCFSPFDGSIHRLDVAWYEIDRDIRTFHKGHSGTLGAIATREVAQDWSVAMRIWWDLDNPPESLLLQGWGCCLQLGLGSAAGQATYGLTQQQFYAAPSGMLKRFKVRNSSEGNDDDIVVADALVIGNSRLFQLPQQMQDYDSYMQALTALGQANFPASFSIMQ